MVAQRIAGPSRAAVVSVAAVGVALLLGLTSLTVATPLKVNKGTTERGFGEYVGFSNVGGWWTYSRMALGAAPVGGAAAGTVVTSPTLLPRNGSLDLYIGGVTSGTTAFVWTFGAATTSPASTELELRFNASWPGGGYSTTVYVETPSLAPTTLVIVHFYAPVPSITLGPITLESYVELSRSCTAPGNCP